MQTEKIKANLINQLCTIMPKNEAQSEIEFVLREKFNLSRTDLILSPQKLAPFLPELENIVRTRIETRKPLQYIINKATFCEDIYYVDENVLIPRPETELLVNAAAKHLNQNSKILEIGTGSGCISIQLAKILKNDFITSCDISQEALTIAKRNAQNLCNERKINFVKSDIYENITEKYDAIISNPPYIPQKDAETLEPEVLNHEPHLALFAENEGMYCYEKIIIDAKNHLNNDGFIALESGENQAKKIEKLLLSNNFTKVITIPDLCDIDRIVIAW